MGQYGDYRSMKIIKAELLVIDAATLTFLQEFVETLQTDPSQAEHDHCSPKECPYARFYAWVAKLTIKEPSK